MEYPKPEFPKRYEPPQLSIERIEPVEMEVIVPEEPIEPYEEEPRFKAVDWTGTVEKVEELPYLGLPANARIRGSGIRRPLWKSRAVQHSLELGLRWLAEHQDIREDGRWDCDGFMKHDPRDDRNDGPGGALFDVGVTGLALLAFVGAGYTDRGRENSHAGNVRRGLRFLTRNQDREGCFGPRSSQKYIYNTAIATLAMCEAYGATRNPRWRSAAQRGLNFIARARNPYMAWRYEPRGGENDTSVTFWMVMALHAGKRARLDVDPDAFEGARQWIDKITDPNFGQTGYNMPGGSSGRPAGLTDRYPPEKSQAMTAAGIHMRFLLGQRPASEKIMRKGLDLCLDLLPTWNPDDGSIDLYYWYLGSLAMQDGAGKYHKEWIAALKEAVLRSQHPEDSGARTGSWDPIGPWGGEGGRIYSTALMTLSLQTCNRRLAE
ncbi:MAG: prenyltransferase/squalene oxidase repeat-containing protein [Planctomycetota bacterium]|jgi:hypothetical protein